MGILYKIQPKIKYQGKLYDIIKLEDPDDHGRFRLASIRDNKGEITWNITDFEIVVDANEIVKELGEKGGQATKSKNSKDYYKKIGLLGAKKRWKNKK